MTDERRMILQMLQEGKLTVDETERLLAAMREPPLDDAPTETAGGERDYPLRGNGQPIRLLLASVDLSGVNLRGTRLDGADLKGADLAGANLADADLTDA